MAQDNQEVTTSRQWVFPPKRCPRCKGFNSEATHTDPERGVQYRRCRTPLCRAVGIRFSVKGEPAEPPARESKELRCPHCGATYRRQGDLTKHIHKVHGGEPPEGETSDGRNDN